ncbi:MAG: hypothetical protein ACOX2O_09930 [Bdellovibrionota bacterium]|jgi:hypothetical protein
MDDFNNRDSENKASAGVKGKSGRTFRARNRTVMLTPEITGEMRARISRDKLEASKITSTQKLGDPNTGQPVGNSRPPFQSALDGNEVDLGRVPNEIPITPLESPQDRSFNVAQTAPRPPLNDGSVMMTSVVTPQPNFTRGRTPDPIQDYGMQNKPLHHPFDQQGRGEVAPFGNAPQARPPLHPYDEVPPAYQRLQPFEKLPERTTSPTPAPQHAPVRQVQTGRHIETPEKDLLVSEEKTPLVGILVSYDHDPNGEVFELRVGRLIVTSEVAGHKNYLYLNDQTVSPMHAILRVTKGTPIQVLDQLSECATKIWHADSGEKEELIGEKGVLKHGDKVAFGERKFTVCLLTE